MEVKNIKKVVISFAIAIMVVIIVQLILNNFDKSNVTAYIALKDIYKDEKILDNCVKEIKVKRNSETIKYANVDIKNKFAKENIVCGKLIGNDDVTSKVEKDEKGEYEYVTIEVKDISDSVAYQLKKDEYVSVYYTSKDEKFKNLFLDKYEMVQNGTNITFRLFEKIKVLGLYNSVGKEASSGEQYKAIMLRVTKEEAMMISNIKGEGSFTIAIIK